MAASKKIWIITKNGNLVEATGTKAKAIELGVRAVAAAIERDAASGNSILVSVIDKDGYQEVSKDKILKIWKK